MMKDDACCGYFWGKTSQPFPQACDALLLFSGGYVDFCVFLCLVFLDFFIFLW